MMDKSTGPELRTRIFRATMAIGLVVAFSAGHMASETEIIATARQRLAAYKAPKQVVVVERIVRSPAGKADYRWAKETAARAAAG